MESIYGYGLVFVLFFSFVSRSGISASVNSKLIKLIIIASILQIYHFCSRNPDQTLFQEHSFRLFLQKNHYYTQTLFNCQALTVQSLVFKKQKEKNTFSFQSFF